MQRLRIHAISGGRIGTGTLMVLAERLLTALVVVTALLAMLAIMGFNLTTSSPASASAHRHRLRRAEDARKSFWRNLRARR